MAAFQPPSGVVRTRDAGEAYFVQSWQDTEQDIAELLHFEEEWGTKVDIQLVVAVEGGTGESLD